MGHNPAVTSKASVRVLTSSADVEALVDELLDPSRGEPVVAVTTRNGEAEPLIDVQALAAKVAPLVVRLVPTGPLTWDLTGLLPERLGVFGGAARIWWPGLSRDDPPHRHPLVFAYSPEEGRRAIERISQELTGRAAGGRLGTRPKTPAHRPRDDDRRTTEPAGSGADPLGPRPFLVGDVVPGKVVEAAPGGAEVEVAAGCSGWLVRRRRDPELSAGDIVEVRVTGYDGRIPLLERPPRLPPTRTRPGAEPRVAIRPGPHLFRRHPGQAEPRVDASPSPAPSERAAARQIALLREEVELLRSSLRAAEEERLASERRQEAAELETARAIRTLARSEREAKAQLRSARDRMAWLEGQLHGAGRFEDAEEQLRHEIAVEWARSHVGTDRDLWPLRQYHVGPDFLRSLAALEGVCRSKVVEVCVEVLTGRAERLASRELHPLRTGEGGSGEQRVRPSDGAKAWRVSLQVRTPSARRLHFWRLPSGTVELARVGVHDDLSIR